jgi:hypothetical protein
MAVEWICDGCGRREPGATGNGGDALKPREWYCRSDKDGRQDACSRRCIELIAAKSGKTACVLPI